MRDRDAYLLEMNPEPVEPVRKRLTMFVLRTDVVIENAEDTRIRFGLSGPTAEAQLSEALGAVPAEVNEVLTRNDVTVVRVPQMVHPRFELAGEIDACRALWDDLNVHCAPVGPEGWRLLDILAGIPAIYPETSETFVPQMINLHALGGISFSKGCYPGQEVVARMHYLGKLKRRMFRLAIEGQDLPLPGSPVFRAGGDPSQPDGAIVDAVLHPDGLYAALAVLQIAAATEPLRWGSPDGAVAHVIPLPYTIPGGA
jgi:tRNA-modifying protein YgfZ